MRVSCPVLTEEKVPEITQRSFGGSHGRGRVKIPESAVFIIRREFDTIQSVALR